MDKIPSIDPIALQQKQLAGEEQKRFDEIADKIIKILGEENVITKELSRITTALTDKINKKVNTSEIKSILEL